MPESAAAKRHGSRQDLRILQRRVARIGTPLCFACIAAGLNDANRRGDEARVSNSKKLEDAIETCDLQLANQPKIFTRRSKLWPKKPGKLISYSECGLLVLCATFPNVSTSHLVVTRRSNAGRRYARAAFAAAGNAARSL